MAEYANLPALAAAAEPDRLVLAWIDRPISPPPAAPNVITLPVHEARRLAIEAAGPGYGLPFTAKLDRNGNACAVWRSPLKTGDFAALRTRCLQ